jgi:hypothetical protein
MGVFWESQKERGKKGDSSNGGVNHGSNKKGINVEDQTEGLEGVISAKIPNLPHILHDTWKQNKEGDHRGAGFGFMTESSPNGKNQLSPAKMWSGGNISKSPILLPMGLGGSGASSGGQYSGPILAEVERSV